MEDLSTHTDEMEVDQPSAEQLKALEVELKDFDEVKDVVRTNGHAIKEIPSTIDALLRNAAHYSKISSDPLERCLLENIRLVLFFAKRFKHTSMYEDMIQVGALGMLKSLEKYDPAKGKLSVWCGYAIKKALWREYNNKAYVVRLPVNVSLERARITKIAVTLQQKLGRRPTLIEIAESADLNIKHVTEAFEGLGTVSFSLNETNETLGIDTEAGEMIPDLNAIQPDDAAVQAEESVLNDEAEIIDNLRLKKVSERDIDIFIHFYCLNSKVKIHRTLEDTACKFKLTRERIRQIVNKISKKLNPSKPKQLRSNPPKTVKPIHVRASLAYADWLPKSESQDPLTSTIEFVAYAYELDNEKFLSAECNPEINWARTLIAIILLEDFGWSTDGIEGQFLGFLRNVELLVFEFSKVNNENQIMRKDIDGLRAHFRKVMRLEIPN